MNEFKELQLNQRERHYLEDLLLNEIREMGKQNITEDFFELRISKQIVNKLIDISDAKSDKFDI